MEQEKLIEEKTENISKEKETEILEKLDTIKTTLGQIWKNKTQGDLVRAKLTWIEEGEQPSKYFLNLEKHRSSNKALHFVYHKNKEIKGAKNVIKACKDFYQELYSNNNIIDTDNIDKFLKETKVQN